MFKRKDPYSFSKFCTLLKATDEIGSIHAEYQVSRYDEVQLVGASSVNKSKHRKFFVQCTQRVNVFNKSGLDVSPSDGLHSYDNYPLLINTLMNIDPSSGVDFQLLDYSPQTVNSKIQASGTVGDITGATQSNSNSNTIGSSTSQTNSYGASVTVGAADMGDLVSVSGSVSANYEHSSTTSNDQSQTSGTSVSNDQSQNNSNSDSMSIKDWGAYSLVNPATKSPAWTFGQEFPWDAIECRRSNGEINPKNDKQEQIVIPNSMTLQLYDGVSLYPPSQLSTFGVNFVMKAAWIVTIQDGTSDDITIEHTINYFSGSHIVDTAKNVKVYMDMLPAILNVNTGESLNTEINLALMALNPVGHRHKPAIIGFVPNKFIIKPEPISASGEVEQFKIISETNNLMIEDSTGYPSGCDEGVGFTYSETALTANFGGNCLELQMTIYLKVIDTVNNFTLFIKHWKTGPTGVILTFVINGDTNNPIVKYVDALEAEGGENNLLSIVLRNHNYASVDYSDYLQLGLNSIDISIKPIGGQFVPDNSYQIRAISIEMD